MVAVIQNADHELPTKLQQDMPMWRANEQTSKTPSSPTAKQRLAALSSSTTNLPGMHSSGTTSRKQMHRRKKVVPFAF